MTQNNENRLQRLIEKFPGVEEIECSFLGFKNGELYFQSEEITHELIAQVIPLKDCWLEENEHLEDLVKKSTSIILRGSIGGKNLWEEI